MYSRKSIDDHYGTLTFDKDHFDMLAIELINFMKKWGLWEDATILTNGNKYDHTYDSASSYKGISNVEFSENVRPEEYTTGLLGYEDCSDKIISKSFSNPEHLLDIVFEGPLYMLLSYDEYEVKKGNISKEAWDYIFSHSEIIEQYLLENYDEEDFSEEEKEYSNWDPLEFDTWEEYQEFSDYDMLENEPLFTAYDTYLQYQNKRDIQEEKANQNYERMIEQVRRDVMKETDELIRLPKLVGYLVSEFDKIFDKYGLWYDFGFSYTITCFKLD